MSQVVVVVRVVVVEVVGIFSYLCLIVADVFSFLTVTEALKGRTENVFISSQSVSQPATRRRKRWVDDGMIDVGRGARGQTG